MKHLLLPFLALLALTGRAQNLQQGDYGWLYCHMSDRGEWTAYAVSRDGLHYEDIADGLPIFNTDRVAQIEGGTRDAYITRAHDGKGYLMVTTDMCVARSHRWDNYGINLLRSDDLLHWEARTFDFRRGAAIFCDPKSKDCYRDYSKVHRVWAPQIFWDPAYKWPGGKRGGYLIYYSMLNDEEDGYDRMYYSYADESFTKLTKPRLLFDWGYATIDADINLLPADGLYHMLIKKEGGRPGIYTATAKHLTGPWSEPVEDDYVSFEGQKKCEGSSAFQLPGETGWRVAYIQYSDRPKHYRICQADERLRNFRDPQDITGVTGPQHGSFMRITEKEYRRLKNWSDSLKAHPRRVAVSVANPAATARRQVVEVDAQAVRRLLDASRIEPLLVRNAFGQPVGHQLTHDGKLLFEANVLPGDTMTYTVERGFAPETRSYVQGKQYRQRLDDLAWENDCAAYRLYGPALRQTGERSYGIDVWTKNTPELVLDRRYETDARGNVVEDSLRRLGRNADARQTDLLTSFHLDHGDGMDAYAVGATLGCGAPALMVADSLYMPWCYDRYRILDNGPLRFTVELSYPAALVGHGRAGQTVTEHRRISLDKGSHFNRMTVWYDGLTTPVTLAPGVVLHGGQPLLGPASVLYADPTDQPRRHQSHIFVGCLFPQGVDATRQHQSADGTTRHALGLVERYKGDPYTYYFGSAWSLADVHTLDDWQREADLFLESLRQPLQITLQ